MKKITQLLLGLLIALNVQSQDFQLNTYNQEIFKETFNSDKIQFPIEVNSDNYIVVDDGDLFLNRTNTKDDLIVFSKNKLLYRHTIKTALKLGPSQKRESFAGIVLNTPKDGSETLAVELNGKQEYRIRKINTKSKYISGTHANFGWVKCELIKKNGVYNNIDIISNKGSYQLYINYEFVSSFEVPKNSSGGFGFIIGANSQARADFIYAYKACGETVNKVNNDLKNIESKIDKLSSQGNKISELEKENNSLIQQLKNSK